jgi:hypothetical protein
MKLLIHQVFTFGPVKHLSITDLANEDGINLSWESAEVFSLALTCDLGGWLC